MLQLFGTQATLEMHYQGYGKSPKVCNKVCLKQWDYTPISYLELLKQAELPTLGQRREYKLL